MKIKIEMEIENCQQCPFAQRVYGQGYSGTDCMKLGSYSTIPQEGFLKNCPFLEKAKVKNKKKIDK